jgi:hypothetical protein
MPANPNPPPGLTADEKALYKYTAGAGPLSAYGASHQHMRENAVIWDSLPREMRERLPKTEDEARDRLEALVARGVIRHVNRGSRGIGYGVPGSYHPDDEVNSPPRQGRATPGTRRGQRRER